ncbi:Lrp/AsnC family transcriptional regulator [Pseudonocardia spinosispora]|uniref:Lrp/AsnC family transcriptional regulator n=1 Tax=Pseudonocardia spinosispora TaxID=103441 RepID=UPI0003F77D09|nr:Lrp/AsnC family transcriptional regulator [Pseudonocardia spinosispora]
MREILEILARDGHATPERIATMTDIPVQTVRERISAWENEGIIRRYKAVVDWDRYDQVSEADQPESITAFIDLSIGPARGVGFDDVAERISRFPEVRSVYLVSGSQDLRCTVTGRTLREVSDFVAQKLSTIDRVHSTATYFVLKTYKRDGDAFIEPEADHRLPVVP